MKAHLPPQKNVIKFSDSPWEIRGHVSFFLEQELINIFAASWLAALTTFQLTERSHIKTSFLLYLKSKLNLLC